MSVLIITQYFWPENFRINELVDKIKNKVDLEIITGEPNYPNGHIFLDYKKNKSFYNLYNGVKIHRVPIIPRRKNFFFLTLNYLSFCLSATIYSIFKFKKKKIKKIFFFGTSPLISSIPAIILSKIKGIKCDIWLLDFWPDTLYQFNFFKIKFIQIILNYICKKIYFSFDKIYVQSEEFKKILIERYKYNPNKIIYIPAWTEEIYNNKKKITNNKYKNIRKKIRIVFSGNLGHAQNIVRFIGLIKSIKNSNIKIFFIGDGIEKRNIKHAIEKYDLKNNIILTKSYKNERMPSILNDADFLLLILKDIIPFNITIPGKFQNYLGLGKPIISISNPVTHEIVTKNNLGIAFSQKNLNYIDLEKQISALYSNEEKYKFFSNNCINYSKNFYFKDNICLKILNEIKN